MPLDTTTQLVTAISATLTGDAMLDGLIRPALRTDRLTVVSKKREPSLVGAASNAKLLIEARGGSESDAPKVFCDNDATKTIGHGLPDRVMPSTQQIAIVFTYAEDFRGNLVKQTPCEARVNALLKSKWPKLGLAWVANFTVTQWTRQTNQSEDANSGSQRKVDRSTMLLTFNLRPWLSQLSA